jgi:hypothetical protein
MNFNALGIPSRAEPTGLHLFTVHLEARNTLPLPPNQVTLLHQQSRQGRALATWTPGIPATWFVGTWSTCNNMESVLSPIGQQIRSVRCLTIGSHDLQQVSRCFSASEPVAAQMCYLPGSTTCDWTEDAACSSAGTCADGQCHCRAGTRGSRCQVNAACATVVDGLGKCCASGLVSAVTGAFLPQFNVRSGR